MLCQGGNYARNPTCPSSPHAQQTGSGQPGRFFASRTVFWRSAILRLAGQDDRLALNARERKRCLERTVMAIVAPVDVNVDLLR